MQLLATRWPIPSSSPSSNHCLLANSPSLYTEHDVIWYGICPWLGWVSCPGGVPSQLPVQLARQASERSWKVLDCLATTKNISYVINIVFVPNPNRSTTPATRMKINSIPAKTRTSPSKAFSVKGLTHEDMSLNAQELNNQTCIPKKVILIFLFYILFCLWRAIFHYTIDDCHWQKIGRNICV